MNDKLDLSTEVLGLVAHGASGSWDISVDESLGRHEWFVELDGPQTYLVFQLSDLQVLRTALRFLETGLQVSAAREGRARRQSECALTLGRFGPSSVTLLRDNEGFPRYFLVIGPKARSTLRLSLQGEDFQRFLEALRQVVQGLPQLPAG